MKRNLLLILAIFVFSIGIFGQGSPKPTPTPLTKPPVYIMPDVLTSISQVKDVTSKDEYFIHLKALIESHKVKNLTTQYKYNGSAKLNSPDLVYMSSNGRIAMLAIAKQRFTLLTQIQAQFGSGCSGPEDNNADLTEAVVVDYLKCQLALAEIKNNTPTNIVTKGRFAMLLNQALNLWIRKVDALK